MPEHVLVTGGAGFIGSHFVERLSATGYEVSIIDDLSRGRREWLPVGCRLHEVDIRDGDAVCRVVARAAADLVVHLAALHFIPAVDDAPELAWDINVQGTANLISALRASPVKRLVFASTAAVYPESNHSVSETTRTGPIDLYGRTKLAGEKMVEDFQGDTGTECVVARLFNVIGPRETNPHVVAEIIDQLTAGATELKLGSLHPRRDYTDVRDVAEALHRLLDRAPRGFEVFNVGSGKAISVSDVVTECERILGRRIPARTDETRVRKLDREFLVADSSSIRSLGWAPKWTLAETLAELLDRKALNSPGAVASGAAQAAVARRAYRLPTLQRIPEDGADDG
jgi:UDP-glucose 4-epimerase